MCAKELHRISAVEALKLIRDGDLTIEAYASALLDRIKKRDSVVKAWAYLDPDSVITQAKALDKVPLPERGPLHGIPVGVKDVYLTKDMPTAYNSEIYRGQPTVTADAAAVITLRAAGALIFGKTTTTEFASTVVGGPSTNPHDPTRTPGGSSSGSGAAVGDYQVPIALGTQTVGSTIRPGSFNGIYAFKPTWGAISREGFAQYSMTCDTVGLYARSVEDLDLLASVFKLADDEVVSTQPLDLKGAKVAFCKTHVWPEAGPGTRNAFSKAQELLASRGANVCELDLPSEFAAISRWHEIILAGEGRSSFLGNYSLAKDKLHSSIQAHVENAQRFTKKQLLESYDGCARLRPLWDEIASKYDVVITPSVVDEAPVGIERTGSAVFNGMWTILHAPCLNLPGFAGENGLPVGLTLVGGRYHDLGVLRAGKTLGEIFERDGGFVSKIP
ncbi:uncharacterized protein PV09_07031 [Verruconis gallopava]|uniref:Amidase domain-containing protein n=1 Tax=Verruconis gallopava TaxID=253628 RepID=A0A0D2AQW1_9PEZI|nr:uncharacterized protein PV09_07031 [Verruconis gallopava]KIW01554.1 hypothetical protein PV09_07031 [Verruconis gallopava]